MKSRTNDKKDKCYHLFSIKKKRNNQRRVEHLTHSNQIRKYEFSCEFSHCIKLTSNGNFNAEYLCTNTLTTSTLVEDFSSLFFNHRISVVVKTKKTKKKNV